MSTSPQAQRKRRGHVIKYTKEVRSLEIMANWTPKDDKKAAARARLAELAAAVRDSPEDKMKYTLAELRHSVTITPTGIEAKNFEQGHTDRDIVGLANLLSSREVKITCMRVAARDAIASLEKAFQKLEDAQGCLRSRPDDIDCMGRHRFRVDPTGRHHGDEALLLQEEAREKLHLMEAWEVEMRKKYKARLGEFSELLSSMCKFMGDLHREAENELFAHVATTGGSLLP